MPSKKQEFSFPGYDSTTLLQFTYGTVLQLGWTPKYFVENVLVAHTPGKWNKYNDEIEIRAFDNSLTVTSKLIHGERFDLMGKNKRHIQEFLSAFENIKQGSLNPEWKVAIEQLRQQTEVQVAEELKQEAEVNKAMNLSGSNLYMTYGIIAINAIVFVLMAMQGAGIFEANPAVHIKWGSNYTPLTLSGDWWRLLTNVFIHFGIIHIAMNTYAFYMVGVYLEPMLGKTKYITAYLCTGILASLTSLWWHKEGVNSAGASGAIFGMYGVFLALLFTNLIPKRTRAGLLQSIGLFVVYNLVYGMKSGVDNAAHIGGLISGMTIGLVYYITRPNEEQASKKTLPVLAIAVATMVIAGWYLNNNSVAGSERDQIKSYLNEASYKDHDKMLQKFNEFNALEEKALAPFNDTTLNYITLAKALNKVSGEWDKATGLVEEIKSYDVSPAAKEKIGLFGDYVEARKEEITIINRIAEDAKSENFQQLDSVRNKISGIIKKLGE